MQKFSHIANTIWFTISDIGVDLPVTDPFREFENGVGGLDLGTCDWDLEIGEFGVGDFAAFSLS